MPDRAAASVGAGRGPAQRPAESFRGTSLRGSFPGTRRATARRCLASRGRALVERRARIPGLPDATREAMAVLVGVPKETRAGERRVALTPETAGRIAKLGPRARDRVGGRQATPTSRTRPTARAGGRGRRLGRGRVRAQRRADEGPRARRRRARAAALRPGPRLVRLARPERGADGDAQGQGASPRSRWTRCRASRAPRSSTRLSSMANIAGYIAPSSRPPTRSGASSPARSPPRARCRPRRCS